MTYQRLMPLRQFQGLITIYVLDGVSFLIIMYLSHFDHYMVYGKATVVFDGYIGDRMQQKGCHVIHTEGNGDVDIVKAAVAMASFKSTTLIGEDTSFGITSSLCRKGL